MPALTRKTELTPLLPTSERKEIDHFYQKTIFSEIVIEVVGELL
jgi:hypothetical protein